MTPKPKLELHENLVRALKADFDFAPKQTLREGYPSTVFQCQYCLFSEVTHSYGGYGGDCPFCEKPLSKYKITKKILREVGIEI